MGNTCKREYISLPGVKHGKYTAVFPIWNTINPETRNKLCLLAKTCLMVWIPNNRDEKCIRAVGADTNKGKKEGKVLGLLVWTPTGEKWKKMY
jgi:hypothetical protein